MCGEADEGRLMVWNGEVGMRKAEWGSLNAEGRNRRKISENRKWAECGISRLRIFDWKEQRA